MIENCKLKIENSQRGFVALISAIVISLLLLAITVSLGFSGLFTRVNIADSESKERSLALAEACVNKAVLSLAQNASYSPTNENVPVGTDHCTIISVAPSGSQFIIKTQACINKAITNLQITANADFGIARWEELPNFSPNHTCPG